MGQERRVGLCQATARLSISRPYLLIVHETGSRPGVRRDTSGCTDYFHDRRVFSINQVLSLAEDTFTFGFGTYSAGMYS
jgi:hypothetical protein